MEGQRKRKGRIEGQIEGWVERHRVKGIAEEGEGIIFILLDLIQ
jgi:hypothetical protein